MSPPFWVTQQFRKTGNQNTILICNKKKRKEKYQSSGSIFQSHTFLQSDLEDRYFSDQEHVPWPLVT